LLEATPTIWAINAVVGLSLGKDLMETTSLQVHALPTISPQIHIRTEQRTIIPLQLLVFLVISNDVPQFFFEKQERRF